MTGRNGDVQPVHAISMDINELCCPHCRSKLRIALVSADPEDDGLSDPILAVPSQELSDPILAVPSQELSDPILAVPSQELSDPIPVVPSQETVQKVIEHSADLRLEALERTAILAALQQVNNDVVLAARLLGIGRTTIYRRMKEYGVQPGSTYQNRR
jgi:transcriptional regulator with AAA-type ATPase domain